MLTIDGSSGEGGGQVVRTSLALSVLTGTPFRIVNIRAGRRRPGLLRQHLTGLRAATAISGATVSGDALCSEAFTFEPGPVQPGAYEFAVGTAGSANLVLQTVLPPLMLAGGPSEIALQGGTHNASSPPFHFLRDAFLPVLAGMGPAVELRLDRWGFYPAGGGAIKASIAPVSQLEPLELADAGARARMSAVAVVSGLPKQIADRELRNLRRLLSDLDSSEVHEVRDPAGPGNAVMVSVEHDRVTNVFTGFGARGLRAEKLVEQLALEVSEFVGSEVPVGVHLADQLLIPMALAGRGHFHTLAPSLHTTTNIDVIQRFLDVRFDVSRLSERVWRVEVAEASKGGA